MKKQYLFLCLILFAAGSFLMNVTAQTNQTDIAPNKTMKLESVETEPIIVTQDQRSYVKYQKPTLPEPKMDNAQTGNKIGVSELTFKEQLVNAKSISLDANADAQEKAKANKFLNDVTEKSKSRLADPNVSQAQKEKAQKILDYLNN